jgi:hypothetical protein
VREEERGMRERGSKGERGKRSNYPLKHHLSNFPSSLYRCPSPSEAILTFFTVETQLRAKSM